MGVLARDLRRYANGQPLIAIGDFNANPFEEAIAGSSFIWAVRDRVMLDIQRNLLPETIQHDARFFNEGRTTDEQALREVVPPILPLYNPMWRHLSESNEHPRGTIRYVGHEAVLEWHCYDQILVSAELTPLIESTAILVEMVDRMTMSPTRLIQSDRATISAMFGDHLPIEMVLTGRQKNGQ
jgi:hypothetical protein